MSVETNNSLADDLQSQQSEAASKAASAADLAKRIKDRRNNNGKNGNDTSGLKDYHKKTTVPEQKPGSGKTGSADKKDPKFSPKMTTVPEQDSKQKKDAGPSKSDKDEAKEKSKEKESLDKENKADRLNLGEAKEKDKKNRKNAINSLKKDQAIRKNVPLAQKLNAAKKGVDNVKDQGLKTAGQLKDTLGTIKNNPKGLVKGLGGKMKGGVAGAVKNMGAMIAGLFTGKSLVFIIIIGIILFSMSFVGLVYFTEFNANNLNPSTRARENATTEDESIYSDSATEGSLFGTADTAEDIVKVYQHNVKVLGLQKYDTIGTSINNLSISGITEVSLDGIASSFSGDRLDTTSDDSITRNVHSGQHLPESYVPANLVPLVGATDIPNWNNNIAGSSDIQYMRKEAADAFVKMCNDAYKERQLKILPLSGYRSYATQLSISGNGMTGSAGGSEHQTGLAMDVWTPLTGQDTMDEFKNTAEYGWLDQNAHKYGFVESMPPNYGGWVEPWHWRFIGVEAATLYREELTKNNKSISIYGWLDTVSNKSKSEIYPASAGSSGSSSGSALVDTDKVGDEKEEAWKIVVIPEGIFLESKEKTSEETGLSDKKLNIQLADELTRKLLEANFNTKILCSDNEELNEKEYVLGKKSDYSSKADALRAAEEFKPHLILVVSHDKTEDESGISLMWSSYRKNIDQDIFVKESDKKWPGTNVAYKINTQNPSDMAKKSRDLAEKMQDKFTDFKIEFNEIIERDDFWTVDSTVRSVIYQGGSIYNQSDADYMNMESYCIQASKRIVSAVKEHFNYDNDNPDGILESNWDALYFLCALDASTGNYVGEDENLVESANRLKADKNGYDKETLEGMSYWDALKTVSKLLIKMITNPTGFDFETEYVGYYGEEYEGLTETEIEEGKVVKTSEQIPVYEKVEVFVIKDLEEWQSNPSKKYDLKRVDKIELYRKSPNMRTIYRKTEDYVYEKADYSVLTDTEMAQRFFSDETTYLYEVESNIANRKQYMEWLNDDLDLGEICDCMPNSSTEYSYYVKTDEKIVYGSDLGKGESIDTSEEAKDAGLAAVESVKEKNLSKKSYILLALGMQPNAPYKYSMVGEKPKTYTTTNAQMVEQMRLNYLAEFGEALNNATAGSFVGGSSGSWLWPYAEHETAEARALAVTSIIGGRPSPGGVGSTDHKGTDIAAGYGTEIHAIGDGEVMDVVYGSGWGTYVLINHGMMNNGTNNITKYGHLSAVKVNIGDKVTANQVIGLEGATGNVSGPHLHLECRESEEYGTVIDAIDQMYPASYVNGPASSEVISDGKGPTVVGGAPEDPSQNPWAPVTATASVGNASYKGDMTKGLTPNQLNTVIAVIMHEAGPGSPEGIQGVTSCIINRVASARYPATAYDVVTAPNQFESYFGDHYLQYMNTSSYPEIRVQILQQLQKGMSTHPYVQFRGYSVDGGVYIGGNCFFDTEQ